VAKGEPPSSLDMLIKVEQSLTMPCQEDETSSMEGHQRKAVERLKNLLVTIEETCKGGSGGCLVPHTSEYNIVVFSCTVGNV